MSGQQGPAHEGLVQHFTRARQALKTVKYSADFVEKPVERLNEACNQAKLAAKRVLANQLPASKVKRDLPPDAIAAFARESDIDRAHRAQRMLLSVLSEYTAGEAGVAQWLEASFLQHVEALMLDHAQWLFKRLLLEGATVVQGRFQARLPTSAQRRRLGGYDNAFHAAVIYKACLLAYEAAFDSSLCHGDAATSNVSGKTSSAGSELCGAICGSRCMQHGSRCYHQCSTPGVFPSKVDYILGLSCCHMLRYANAGSVQGQQSDKIRARIARQ
jgi:hypothetical protein